MKTLDKTIMQTKTVCSIVDVLLEAGKTTDNKDIKDKINYIKKVHSTALRSMMYYKNMPYYKIKQCMFDDNLHRERYLDPRKYDIKKLNKETV